MSANVSEFISHVVLHFGEPKFDVSDTDKPKAYNEWLRSLARSLRGFSPECLKKASEVIVETRKYRSFPLVSECIDACKDAQIWLNAQKPQLRFGPEKRMSEFSPDRTQLADELIMGEMGRMAAKEGWISALHQFCRKEMRLPDRDEIKGCINAARAFDGGLEMARRGDCGPQSHAILQLGLTMLSKRQALADRVLHGVIA